MTRSLFNSIRLTHDFCIRIERAHKGALLLYNEEIHRIVDRTLWIKTSDASAKKTFIIQSTVGTYMYDVEKFNGKKKYPRYAHKVIHNGVIWEYKKTKSSQPKKRVHKIPDYSIW